VINIQKFVKMAEVTSWQIIGEVHITLRLGKQFMPY